MITHTFIRQSIICNTRKKLYQVFLRLIQIQISCTVSTTTRAQRVVVNGSHSSWLPVISGVPQGSILGLLLFILYVNDIKSVISHSYLKMFADDLTLYRNIASVSDCELLQWDLRRIYEWTLTWLLRLNPLKCEALNINNKRCPLHFNYYIGSHLISWVQKVKYLGVFVTSKLNWSDHYKYCVHKATVCLNHLCRIMFGASFLAKNIAYKCLVRPHLEYACPVWSPFTSSNIKLIESVQRRAAR